MATDDCKWYEWYAIRNVLRNLLLRNSYIIVCFQWNISVCCDQEARANRVLQVTFYFKIFRCNFKRYWRYFTYAFVLVDILYSSSYATVQPVRLINLFTGWFIFPVYIRWPRHARLFLYCAVDWKFHDHSSQFELQRSLFLFINKLYFNYNYIQISYQLWFLFFLVVILCISCRFIYRYGLLCR